jgi:hypothetical protein
MQKYWDKYRDAGTVSVGEDKDGRPKDGRPKAICWAKIKMGVRKPSIPFAVAFFIADFHRALHVLRKSHEFAKCAVSGTQQEWKTTE